MEWKEFAEKIYRYTRLNTFPIAVKLFEKREDIPETVRMAKHKVNICQLVAFAKLYGWTLAAVPEQMICAIGASDVGLIEVPERIKTGSIFVNIYVKDAEAAKLWEASAVKLPKKYDAIMCSAVERTPIDPDVIVMYGNSAQVQRFIQGSLWHEGGAIEVKTIADAGLCSNAIASVMLNKKPILDVPCYGDRRFGFVQDHEFVFSIPAEMAENLVEGLEETHKAGTRYPVPVYLNWSPKMPKGFEVTEEDLK